MIHFCIESCMYMSGSDYCSACQLGKVGRTVNCNSLLVHTIALGVRLHIPFGWWQHHKLFVLDVWSQTTPGVLNADKGNHDLFYKAWVCACHKCNTGFITRLEATLAMRDKHWASSAVGYRLIKWRNNAKSDDLQALANDYVLRFCNIIINVSSKSATNFQKARSNLVRVWRVNKRYDIKNFQ